MTDLTSFWKKTVRRHPRALSSVVLALWCVQLVHWSIWEYRRKPSKRTPSLSQANVQEADVYIEPPMLMADPDSIPASPFTTEFPIDSYSDLGGEFQPLDESEAAFPPPIAAPPKPHEDPPPAVPPKNPAEALESLRYCGFMQTTHGARVAFIEDKTARNILRIQVGESIENWELLAIARDRIIFTAEKEEPVEILRDFLEAEAAPPAEPIPTPKKTEKAKPKAEAPEAEKETPEEEAPEQ